MYPADWIWQQYGLCLGWRCAKCKEKVMARSLPFKGLRKRKLDPDELRAPSSEEGLLEDEEFEDGSPGRPGQPRSQGA
jgi:hypothetical protein